ncbi:MAG TPA: polyribonucleotide nucleotidyltransferase [Saprospiraceae bacterium]|nr:polyribonucleotide nucleotidyltransferase [Saprospiraceae bacterium]
MGQKIPISTSFDLPDGRTVTIETGKLASQADGSVVVRMGDTMIFATAVSAREAREGQSFFPLSVDYQEKFAAAGRVPGNFFRRETKLNDYEVIISRLVDRAIRPLFPEGYMHETQIILNLISGETEVLPDAMAALAASAAMTVSDIPFDGPISEVRVARIKGEFVINPNRSDLEKADMDFIVAASMDNVMMVEGEAKECQEKDLVEAIRVAHEAIKVQCQAQLDLAEKVGDKSINREVEPLPADESIKEKVAALISEPVKEMTRSALNKKERKEKLKAINEQMREKLTEDLGEEAFEEQAKLIDYYYEKIKKQTIRDTVLDEQVRLDGRAFNEVRDIWTEIDYLPAAHGSAIFTRGETQSLTSLTLGTKLDKKMVDTALVQDYEDFILHYNFPGYSVGEVKPQRGPGRREVGHANLAARSLKQVMPEENPYTIRIVSDIMESNGSSSMATVCAGSLALMDAGINVKSPVSGIAMGMIAEGDKMAILSDILGDEDALGDMDFKVTGTNEGICACQMDIKIDGLPYEQLEAALDQAREGRLHILGEMSKTIATPREDYKEHAPRIVELTIDKSFIGAVIGPGGKVIQEIQEVTGTVINIEEVDNKGIVSIASSDGPSVQAAVDRIKKITFTPDVGDEYDAVVKTVMPYGVFVDFLGKSGLLHVSEISHSRIEKVEDHFSEGDEVRVKLIGIDPKTGKMRLSRKALLPKSEGGGDGGGGGERRKRERRKD